MYTSAANVIITRPTCVMVYNSCVKIFSSAPYCSAYIFFGYVYDVCLFVCGLVKQQAVFICLSAS